MATLMGKLMLNILEIAYVHLLFNIFGGINCFSLLFSCCWQLKNTWFDHLQFNEHVGWNHEPEMEDAFSHRWRCCVATFSYSYVDFWTSEWSKDTLFGYLALTCGVAITVEVGKLIVDQNQQKHEYHSEIVNME